MNDATDPSAADETILPVRYYWLKRILVGSVLLLAASGVLWWQALRLAEGRLEGEIQRLRAAGEPVLVTDFAESRLEDEANAAYHYREAWRLIQQANPGVVDDLSATGNVATPARSLLSPDSAALRHIRKARSCSGTNWGTEVRTPAIAILLPHLNDYRWLAKVLQSAALQACREGDEAAAIEFTRDILALCSALEHQPFLICHLVALGSERHAVSIVETIAPKLRIGDSAGAEQVASEEQVAALVRELLDDKSLRAGLIYAMQAERMAHLDTIRWLALRNESNGWFPMATLHSPGNALNQPERFNMARLIAPSLLSEGRDILDWTARFVEAARKDNLPAAKAASPPALPTGRVFKPVQEMLTPALGPFLNRHHSHLLQRRSAAILLAMRQYQLKHGQVPRRLEDLVPAFLPSIPDDPVSGGVMTMPLFPATQPVGK